MAFQLRMKASQFQKYELRSFEKEAAISKEAQYKALISIIFLGQIQRADWTSFFYTIWTKKFSFV